MQTGIDPSAAILDADVLIHTMRFIESKGDLLRMMKTCNTLYDSGIPILLHLADVCLDEDKDENEITPLPPTRMISFSQFILSDPETRGPLVHKLKLPRPSNPARYSGVLSTFLKALAELKNLTYLDIIGLERWLSLDPDLTKALVALTKLEVIHFKTGVVAAEGEGSPADRLLQTLENLHSPVRYLNLESTRLPFLYSPFKLFRNFSTTIEFMQACVSDLKCYAVVYPSLKTLNLIVPTLEAVQIKPISSCAPNLTSLSIAPPLFFAGLLEGTVYENYRQQNILDQKTCAWKPLDYLCGTAYSVYVLGLKCHVRNLDILQFVSDLQMVTLLQTILRDATPRTLSILLTPGDTFPVTLLPTLITDEAGSDLTRLKLCLNLSHVSADDETTAEGIQVSQILHSYIVY